MRGRLTQVAHEAQILETFEDVIARIELPPEETLAGRAHIMMVVVVPALAHRDERDEEAVPALVAARVALLAEDVGERVDGEGAVPEHDRAHDEAPEENVHAEARH